MSMSMLSTDGMYMHIVYASNETLKSHLKEAIMADTTGRSIINLTKKALFAAGTVPMAVRGIDSFTTEAFDNFAGRGATEKILSYSLKQLGFGETEEHTQIIDFAVNPIRSMDLKPEVEKSLREQAKAQSGGSKLKEASIYKKLLNEWKNSNK